MKRGKAWETRLDVWHRQYREQRLGCMMHQHPAVGVGAGGKVFFSDKGPPDYIGWTVKGNFIFDAKEVAEGKLLYCSLLKRHQAEYLETYAAAPGWRAGIMAKLGQRMYWLDWTLIGDGYWNGDSSFDVSKGLEFGKNGWLEVMK